MSAANRTANGSSRPKNKSGEAMSKLGRFCMNHLPDEARSEFIQLYSEVWSASLDELEETVNALRAKSGLPAIRQSAFWRAN